MDKYEIIGRWAQARIVENLLGNMRSAAHEQPHNLNDLVQDIYLSLMEKDDELIENLHETNQYMFYIARMLINNLKSTSSPYHRYYRYRKEWEILPNDKEDEE